MSPIFVWSLLLTVPDAWPETPALPDPGSPAAMTSDTTGQGERVILPFLTYAPETRLGGGALLGYYRRLDPDAETSSSVVALTVTTRRQLIVEWLPDAYLRGGTRVGGEVRFRHFPDVFYGLGPDTPEALEEDYTSRVVNIEASVQGPVRGDVRVGLTSRFRYEKVVRVEEGGLLASDTIRGSDGGTTVGLGAIGTWDTRDNLFSPQRGRYVEASWIVHDGWLGSDFDFHRIVVDVRQFFPVADRSGLGAHAYLEATPGPAPFSLLPPLGGMNRMRGYREGRFRDRVLVTVQTELRFPLWRRFGGAAFVGAGDVAPRLGDLDLSSLEFTGGAGLRFRLTEEGVTLRGDFGLSGEGGQLYFTLGHAF